MTIGHPLPDTQQKCVSPCVEKSRKHSKAGLTSLVLALAVPAFVVLLLIVVVVQAEGVRAADYGMILVVSYIGFLLTGGFVFPVAGMGYGIAGCLQRHRKRRYAVLGIVLNLAEVAPILLMLRP